jgi:hypothetical protein
VWGGGGRGEGEHQGGVTSDRCGGGDGGGVKCREGAAADHYTTAAIQCRACVCLLNCRVRQHSCLDAAPTTWAQPHGWHKNRVCGMGMQLAGCVALLLTWPAVAATNTTSCS